MIEGAKYGHTNLIAEDWRALARFYEQQFGCTPVPPERDFKGRDLERGTGIPGAELRGAHLLLPGHGAEGPTLELFNYNVLEERPPTAVNRPGFCHIAFMVADVPAARDAVLAAGGRAVGEVVTLVNAAGKALTWVYVTDPEGNVIELQSLPKWQRLIRARSSCGRRGCRGRSGASTPPACAAPARRRPLRRARPRRRR
jgi:predicted enzyme related to lactoylglutathione lyase